MEIIKAENLRHIYKTASGEKIALDDINFTIDTGEFTAIIGTNGSGKNISTRFSGSDYENY